MKYFHSYNDIIVVMYTSRIQRLLSLVHIAGYVIRAKVAPPETFMAVLALGSQRHRI